MQLSSNIDIQLIQNNLASLVQKVDSATFEQLGPVLYLSTAWKQRLV